MPKTLTKTVTVTSKNSEEPIIDHQEVEEDTFEVGKLQHGEYTVVTEGDGYNTSTKEFSVNDDTTVSITLEPKTYTLTVEVPNQGLGQYILHYNDTVREIDESWTNEQGTKMTVSGLPHTTNCTISIESEKYTMEEFTGELTGEKTITVNKIG